MPSPEKPATRFPCFAFSALLHCATGALAAFLASDQLIVNSPEDRARQPIHYSLQLIHLNVPMYAPATGLREAPAFWRSLNHPSIEISPNADKSPRGVADTPFEASTFSMPTLVMPQPVR